MDRRVPVSDFAAFQLRIVIDPSTLRGRRPDPEVPEGRCQPDEREPECQVRSAATAANSTTRSTTAAVGVLTDEFSEFSEGPRAASQKSDALQRRLGLTAARC